MPVNEMLVEVLMALWWANTGSVDAGDTFDMVFKKGMEDPLYAPTLRAIGAPMGAFLSWWEGHSVALRRAAIERAMRETP